MKASHGQWCGFMVRQAHHEGNKTAACPIRLSAQGPRIPDVASEPGGEPSEVFAARVHQELALWQAVAKEAGIEPE